MTAAFIAIFLAELGDKTQLSAVALAASTDRPLSVLLGASAALVIVTMIGVFVGTTLGGALPLAAIRKLGACAFIAIGVAMLFGRL